MNVEGSAVKLSSTIEHALAEIARDNDASLCQMAKANDEALIAMAIKLGEAQRELADSRVQVTQLVNEVEQLREDLIREREQHELMFVQAANEVAA